MFRITNTYTERAGSVFLICYIAFLFSGILHFHHYDFHIELSVKTENSESNNHNPDPDFYKICSLHQFSQSLAHLHYTSSGIINNLNPVDAVPLESADDKLLFEEFTKVSPRAPPAVS